METLFEIHMRGFRSDGRFSDHMLRSGRWGVREWVEHRRQELEHLAGYVEDALSLSREGVGAAEALVLAYFDLARVLGRQHEHGKCEGLACFARTEAALYVRFRRAQRRELEELLFPGLALQWVRDMAVLRARSYFTPLTMPERDDRERPHLSPALDARAWVWGLHEHVLDEEASVRALALARDYEIPVKAPPRMLSEPIVVVT